MKNIWNDLFTIVLSPQDNTTSWEIQEWWPIYTKGIQLVTRMLEQHSHFFIKESMFFIGIHEEFLMDSLLLVKQNLEPKAISLIKAALGFICEICRFEQIWRLEHPQSLTNLMRCVQILMDATVSLLYRPKTLKSLVNGSLDLDEQGSDSVNPDEVVPVMNE